MERRRLRVLGIVQGVGFRPFVHALATRLRLVGSIVNDSEGVTIDLQGAPAELDEFTADLVGRAPPLAVINQVSSRTLPTIPATTFTIGQSQSGAERSALVSPDIATCTDCLRELRDPNDRRYRYAFNNCTNCGPRYTIVKDVPYDRARTTMAEFRMCADCALEYDDPKDRRFHAQPVACPKCGPKLSASIEETAARIVRGEIVAIKGLGGYHFAVDAAQEPSVKRLRERKHREEKPFALMVRDLEAARALVQLDEAGAALLANPRRPIVLLPRREGAAIAGSVAPRNQQLGLVLPYTPLHQLLMDALPGPIVLTSGNLSDEPIAHADDEARERLSPIADAFLTHDRKIHIRTDDSVFRVFAGEPMPLRRSRGYAPQPVLLLEPLGAHVLACGGELKNTICAAKNRHAFLSHHIGDLENYEAYRSFTQAIDHLTRLFDVKPTIVAHDLHPEYLSTKWAREAEGVQLVGVQHHHAHVVACLVDNRELGPAIGLAFDGLGYGTDGTLWGGEFLVADARGFERLGHFSHARMPGGTAAIREPWRMAAAHLEAAFGPSLVAPSIAERQRERWPAVLDLARRGINAPLTSSVGRLFDAVAALVGVRDEVAYEGQAAIELEQLADARASGAYPVELIESGSSFEVSCAAIIRSVLHDVERGVAASVVSARFHQTIANAALAGCLKIREQRGLQTVALSGGVFQNALLLTRTLDALRGAGFRVLIHRQVPANDGGISLGQAVIAAASADPR